MRGHWWEGLILSDTMCLSTRHVFMDPRLTLFFITHSQFTKTSRDTIGPYFVFVFKWHILENQTTFCKNLNKIKFVKFPISDFPDTPSRPCAFESGPGRPFLAEPSELQWRASHAHKKTIVTCSPDSISQYKYYIFVVQKICT